MTLQIFKKIGVGAAVLLFASMTTAAADALDDIKTAGVIICGYPLCARIF